MKSKPYLIEIAWLFTIALTSSLFCYFVFGKEIFQNEIAINLHDTYFVTSAVPVVFILFIAISFITYLIKESKRGYARKLQNIITIVLGLLLIVVFSKLVYVVSALDYSELMSQLSNGNNLRDGWSVSPKLATVKDINKESGANFWQITTYLVLFFQMLVVLVISKL